jgi:hypothetical protein
MGSKVLFVFYGARDERSRRMGTSVSLLDVCGGGISYDSVYDIVHDSLGYRKVSCQWVPKLLVDLNKVKRMMM